jgi:3-dehydroquinate synthase/shikimate kinase/3-dehydroquinate synthase
LIVLVGFMGSGKTTVGLALAGLAGLPFADTDRLIERREGRSIGTIFEEEGEEGFRSIEREIVADVLAGSDAVVALGGGAPTDAQTRALLDGETVVYLKTSFETARDRVGPDEARPLMVSGDPRALYEERLPLYEAVADHTFTTDGRSPEVVAKEISDQVLAGGASRVEPRRVTVDLGPRSYDVVVGRGLVGRVAEVMPRREHAEKAFVVSHPSLGAYSDRVLRSLATSGLQTHLLDVPEGEGSKSMAVAADLLSQLADAPAHRYDLVVSVGGGVVSDLAGFVASTYARGLAVLHVPTSLLGQVDAAIGGKTGVNLLQGKNLVGTVHQPIQVVCDVATLDTLPDAELISGMAEVIKYGLIGDPEMLDTVLVRGSDILRRDPQVLEELVVRSATAKASVVSRDELEHGARASLNYGHTFAHALEQISGYSGIRHGEAVALGMIAAAHLARELGRIDDDAVALHRRSLEAVGLPVSATLRIDDLEAAWMRDKKYKEGVRFVLLRDIGVVETGIRVDREVVARALGRMDD